MNESDTSSNYARDIYDLKQDIVKIRNKIIKVDSDIDETKQVLYKVLMHEIKALDKKLTDDFVRTVSQEVSSALSQEGLTKLIGDMIVLELKDHIGIHIKKTVDLVLQSISQRISRELRIQQKVTKELVFSIDSDIRRVLNDLPTTYSYDEKIKFAINQATKKVVDKIELSLDNGDFREYLLLDNRAENENTSEKFG